MMRPSSQSCRMLLALSFTFLIVEGQNSLETIFSLDVFTSQKPCAQHCFTTTDLGCPNDLVASAIGCKYGYCSQVFAATENCYCRPDLQSVALSWLTSCVESLCTVGDTSIDVSSAGSIYTSYCTARGYTAAPAAASASTTAPDNGETMTMTTM